MLEKRFNLTYLCCSMACRQFTNLREKFRGDLISKLNAEVKSLDFMDCPCNCNKMSRINGECVLVILMVSAYTKVYVEVHASSTKLNAKFVMKHM